MILVRIDDQLRVDTQTPQRLVHFLTALDGNVEVAFTAEEKRLAFESDPHGGTDLRSSGKSLTPSDSRVDQSPTADAESIRIRDAHHWKHWGKLDTGQSIRVQP